MAKHGDVFTHGAIELRCGDYRDVLADVMCDALICDPPYGARTHNGQRHGRRENTGIELCSSRGLGYAGWSAEDVNDFVGFCAPRTRGWFCAFTSHDLVPAYTAALEDVGRYVFAPIACVQVGMNVRLAGDGPSNWTTHLVVSRPRTMKGWGTLPGAYVGNAFDAGQNTATSMRRSMVVGSKPLWLMRAIVRDYSRPGDLVCDPCAGGATTLIAAAIEGRRAVGSELDPVTYEKACERIATSGEIERYAPSDVLKHAKQARLAL